MARLTPEQSAALKAKYAAKPPPVKAVEITVDPANRQARLGAEEKQVSAKAAQTAQTAADKRRNVDMLLESQQTGADFSQEVARLNAEEDIKASAPPIYVGAYNPGLTTPLLGYVPPARPMNIAVPKAEAPGIMEAMRPQTMAPPNVAMQSANSTAKVFDDQAFMESIADLPKDQKKRAVNTHDAFKNAFFKLREMNPVETGVTDEELLKELRQQIKDFEDRTGPTLTHGEVTSPTIGGALGRQVTPATLQIARPGALVYFSQLSDSLQREGADAAENTAAADLMRTGVPIMEPVPGNREGLERQSGTRPATPADVARTKEAARRAYIAANPIPLEMLANRDELLANSEKSATGGTLFQKEYVTGATVESSMSQALRNVFAPLNYVIAEGMDLMTPQTTRMREQAGRPVGQKDMSPGAYNIATAGGFNKPIGDLWTYSPVEVVRDNAWFGQTFGLAADLLSLEVGALGGLVSGARAGVGAAKAVKVAGESRRLYQGVIGAAEGIKTGVATTAKSIGLPSFVGQPQKAAFGSELIDKITGPVTRRTSAILAPGDVRLIGASSVAENYKALVAYEDDIARGGTHNTAMDAAKYAAIDSIAVEQMAKQGPSFSPARFVKDSAAEYKEFKDIHETLTAVYNGAPDVDLIKLRPYLKAAASDPAVVANIRGAAGGPDLAKRAPTLKVSQVVDIIKNAPNGLQKVANAAAFDKGFKALDRTVGALEPGKEVIAITPKTFGTKKKADEVVAAARETERMKTIIGLQEANKPTEIRFILGGRKAVDSGYKFSNADETKVFVDMLVNESNTGTISVPAVNKIIGELNSGVISSKSLRELTYSIVDGVAEKLRVAEGQQYTGQGTFATTGLTNKAKAITYGEQTNSIKLAIEKIAGQFTSGIGQSEDVKLARMLDEVQLEEIRAAKSKIGQIDKMLANEFEALDNPAVAARYRLDPNPNKSQKMAAITLGMDASDFNKKTTLNNYLKSTLFGTNNLSRWRMLGDFTPAKGFEYSTFEQIFNPAGLAEVDKIVDKYVALIKTPDDALTLLPQMTDEVEELTKAMQTIEAPSAKAFSGGQSTKITAERDAAMAAAKAEKDAAIAAAAEKRNDAVAAAAAKRNDAVAAAPQIAKDSINKSAEARDAAVATAKAERDAAVAAIESARDAAILKTTNTNKEVVYVQQVKDKAAANVAAANEKAESAIESAKEKHLDLVERANNYKQTVSEIERRRSAAATNTAKENHDAVVEAANAKYAAGAEAANAKYAADAEAAKRSSVGYAPTGTVTGKRAFLTNEFGGKVGEPAIFRLKRPEEALIGTYARNKGDELFVDAMASILANDPLTYSPMTRLVQTLGENLPIEQIIQRAVANQIGGGAPITAIADLYSVPGMKALLNKPLTETTTVGQFLSQAVNNKSSSSAFATLLEDINATAAAVARKFDGGVPAVEFARELQQIANGNIKLSELGDAPNPFSLRNAVRSQLGKEANYNDLLTELGKIAEAEASGDLNAAKVNRAINSMLDLTNSVFYNAILSYNPRFHGRNILSAPFIVHMTTGIGLGPSDILRGARVLDPVSLKSAAKQVLDGGGAALDLRNDIIVTDKLGNQYSSMELYKLAVESGILKTEMSANVDARFLDEAAKLGLGQSMYAKFPGTMNLLSYPGDLANAEDNMWRMATVIHAIEKGETVEGALQLGRRSLFDFGSTSAFERKYVARKVLFWNYFRNSILAGVKSLLENPGRIIRQYKMATDITKMSVGDTDWNNLRFYGPQDAGIASIALQYAPSSRREGHVTVLPNMPYADIASISAGLLYSPMDFLAGQKDLETGERPYGEGFIINKLSPGYRATYNFVAGQTMDDVKMSPNKLSPTHVAAAAAFEQGTGVPAVAALVEMFNAKPRPAVEGEKAFDGVVYEMSAKDFDNYKMYLVKTIQYTGMTRFVNEWSKVYSGDASLQQAIGLTSKYSAPTPASLQRKASDISTGMLEAGTKEKEIQAGQKRPKAPSASGRIK